MSSLVMYDLIQIIHLVETQSLYEVVIVFSKFRLLNVKVLLLI